MEGKRRKMKKVKSHVPVIKDEDFDRWGANETVVKEVALRCEVSKLKKLFSAQVQKIEQIEKNLEKIQEENSLLKMKVEEMNERPSECLYGLNLSFIQGDGDSGFFDKIEKDEIRLCEIFDRTTELTPDSYESLFSDLLSKFLFFSHTVINI